VPLTTLKPLSTIMAEFSSPPRRSRGSRAVPKFPASTSCSVRKTALRFVGGAATPPCFSSLKKSLSASYSARALDGPRWLSYLRLLDEKTRRPRCLFSGEPGR
jgi:hypothetical protein